MTRIDGKPVTPRGTWLETCREAGIELPALCAGGGLAGGGHCRACLIEVDGRTVAACTTPAREGAEVVTDSEALREYRRDLGELLLSDGTPAGEVAAWLARWGADGSRYGRAARTDRRDHSHALVRFEADRCILCRRCLAACEQVQGEFVFAIEGRGADAHLAWGGGPFAESHCTACGACVAACPSEALTHVDHDRALRLGSPTRERTVTTTCGHCGVGCTLEVHVAGEGDAAHIAYVAGAPDAAGVPAHLCARGRFAHGFVRHPDRLAQPLVRVDGALRPASWDEALRAAADGLARAQGVGAVVSARATTEEHVLVQGLLAVRFGSELVACGDAELDRAAYAAALDVLGGHERFDSLDAIERADALLLLGGDALETAPVAGARLRQAALRGARLVVVDPLEDELAALADVHLAPRPGTLAPLLLALANALLEVPGFTAAQAAEGKYREFLRAHAPEASAATTGVPAERVRAAASLLAAAQRPLCAHGPYVAGSIDGIAAVKVLAQLALLGGAKLLPLFGAANSAGAISALAQQSVTLNALLEAAEAGRLGALFVVGEDVVRTAPDAAVAREALAQLPCLIVQETFLTETAALAHVVLPAASALETDGSYGSPDFGWRRVRHVLPPPGEARPGWRIVAELFAACGGPPAATEIAAVHVAVEAMLGRPSGAKPYLAPLAATLIAAPGAGLVLVRVGPRVPGAPGSHDGVALHPEDARALGLAAGQRAVVAGPRGERERRVAISDLVPRGLVLATLRGAGPIPGEGTGGAPDRGAEAPGPEPVTLRAARE